MIVALIAILLGIAYTGLLLYYFVLWQQMVHLPMDKSQQIDYPTITVIVPARNEEKYINNCLTGILAQDYPKDLLEIIVVDDASEDATAQIVKNIAFTDNRLKLIQLLPNSQETAFKKRAIEKAIGIASGEWIVCTDADCVHPKQWLHSLAAIFTNPTVKFVAAPVSYHTSTTLLSVFQTLDFMMLQGITAASVHGQFHSMCNGANIAYEKAAFNEVGGFAGIDKLPSGDDMLLMHKIFKKFPKSTTYCLASTAIVTTYASPTWQSFFQQRIRWASKAAFFEDRRIFWVLLLVYLLNSYLLMAFLLLWWFPAFTLPFLYLLGWKTITEGIFMYSLSLFFNKKNLMPLFPLFQPIHIVYTIIAGWLGRFSQYSWKGRVISKPVS